MLCACLRLDWNDIAVATVAEKEEAVHSVGPVRAAWAKPNKPNLHSALVLQSAAAKRPALEAVTSRVDS